ncbi:hypothetical protein FSP39_008580 [Pinctada imbricata]|uniref:Uncharacterized protein n=1 Tax=Pinctada imbricata TaxID=66713 RepID=A0AA88XVL9_PINIB|nr:hypothetical protein FSP39_008580 [Pinctada imbricata]
MSYLQVPMEGRPRRRSLQAIPDESEVEQFHDDDSAEMALLKMLKKHGGKRRVSLPNPQITSKEENQKSSKHRDKSPTKDLGAFAMPLMEPDLRDATNSNDLPDGDFRPRSGSTGLRGLFSGKSRQRKQSGDSNAKGDSSTSSKVKNFFADAFRPRSKSDLSGVKRPGKKHSNQMKMDQSMDENQLRDSLQNGPTSGGLPPGLQNHRVAPHGHSTPMGQILETQLTVPNVNGKSRHLSSPQDSFMSRFRARSNSDSVKNRPHRKIHKQHSISPPGSPSCKYYNFFSFEIFPGEFPLSIYNSASIIELYDGYRKLPVTLVK